MLVIWGTKATQRKLGRVADYCRRCREARAFRLLEHRRVSHLYWIPLGRGTVVGHTIHCEKCRRAFNADPSAYASTVKDRRTTLEDLCDQTNPNLPELIAARLDAMDRVTAGTATPEERQALLEEAFASVLPDYEKRAAALHIDLWTCLTALSIFVFPLVALIVADVLGLSDDAITWAAVGTIAASIVLLVVLATDARRFFRRRTLPELIAELAPLRPTAEELSDAKGWLQRQGAKLHRRIDPVELEQRIQSRSPTP